MGAIKTFSEFINESVQSDGSDIKKVITTNKELKRRILELHVKQGIEGDILDVSSLTGLIKCDDFSYIFSEFGKVKHIIGIENWDVSKVKNMEGMFNYCYNFNADLSKWDVSNVENMSFMFGECKNFNCDLSNWNVSNVKKMGYMFSGCKKFNCDLSKWNVSNVVESMENMFADCDNFNSDLSNWDVSNVKRMQYMF